jgi:hypothetical protein
VDDAEDAEVILHEYGHAIQDSQMTPPGFGTSVEAGSIGEGFGDYWAVTVSNVIAPTPDPACVADWDSEFDLVLDGGDNFPTRYLLNDASVRLRKPVVSASILGFDGQISTFVPYEGPCYRCLYPTPPPPELAPSCSANGVLGVMAGVMGLLQANEVIKLVAGIGEPLIGRLLLYDSLGTRFTELKVKRDPDCPTCGDHAPEIPESEMGKFPDYEAFCAGEPVLRA